MIEDYHDYATQVEIIAHETIWAALEALDNNNDLDKARAELNYALEFLESMAERRKQRGYKPED